jgi:hypothetical protein
MAKPTWSWTSPARLLVEIDKVAAAYRCRRSEAMRLVVAQGCAVMLGAAPRLAQPAATEQADISDLVEAFDEIGAELRAV